MAKYNKVIQLSGHTDRNAPPKQTTRTETSKIDALIREREKERERWHATPLSYKRLSTVVELRL